MKWAVVFAGLSGAVGVGMGAGAAHGFSAILTPEALGWVRTGSAYQLWHSVLLAAIGLASLRGAVAGAAATLFAVGITLFSGSLYLMAFAEMRWLGAVTPIGGSALILGWGAIAWLGWRSATGRH